MNTPARLGSYGHLVALRAGNLAYLHVHPDGQDDLPVPNSSPPPATTSGSHGDHSH